MYYVTKNNPSFSVSLTSLCTRVGKITQLCLHYIIFFVSETLSGLVKLKNPPFNEISFFDEIFSFFYLVSGFFSE